MRLGDVLAIHQQRERGAVSVRESAAAWRETVFLVGIGKNPTNDDPEIDAASSGPPPVWKSLADCALR